MILKVSCNQPSFQEVAFTKGLNIILADRTKESTIHDSRNSLGKSTLIEIINFCLCGKATEDRLLAKPVRDWTFSIELMLGSSKVAVLRTPSHDDPLSEIWQINPRPEVAIIILIIAQPGSTTDNHNHPSHNS